MSRYIDADKLHYSRIRIIHEDGTIGGYNAVVMSAEIKDAPTADVEEVRYGKWVGEMNRITYYCATCSNCGWLLTPCLSYCGMCGAKMYKEKEI